MIPEFAPSRSHIVTNSGSQNSGVLTVLVALLVLLLPTTAQSQTTFDGQILTIPLVTIGAERFRVELRLQAETDPIRFDVVNVVETSSAPTPDASSFANDMLTIPSVVVNGVDQWLQLSTVSTNPPVLQVAQSALNDADDDDDSRPDIADAFPYDSNETDDTDGDGIGDNADSDDDNDGVADADDDLPKVADYSAVLPLEGNFTAGTFLEELAIEPLGTDTTNSVELGRFQFNSDGSLLVEYPEGRQSGNWVIMDKTLTLNMLEGPGLDFTVQAAGVPQYLAELLVVEAVAGVSQFDLRQVLKRRDLQLVKTSGSENTWWVADHIEISILNDEVNLAWFGETNPAPVELTVESSVRLRSQPDLPGMPFTTELLVGSQWALPLQFEAVGPNRLVSGPAGPNREPLTDDILILSDELVSFQAGGTGIIQSSAQSFNWTIEQDGRLNIVLNDSGNEVALQITQALQTGFEVIATAAKDGTSYYRKSLAMPQDSVIDLNAVFGQYLVRNFYLFSPDNIGSDNRISFADQRTVYIPFKAFNFSADNSGIEHTTILSPTAGTRNIIRPYEWDVDGKQATLLRKDKGSCSTADAGCITGRRIWDLLKYENGRLYVLEEVLYPAPDSSPVVYELGEHRDVEYYDVYELSAAEMEILMQSVVDFSGF